MKSTATCVVSKGDPKGSPPHPKSRRPVEAVEETCAPFRVACGLAIALMATVSLQAQQPIDVRERFRAESELVTIPVTVRDSAGRLVTTLERGDFMVEEDGVVQPITQFERERVPVSLALALDTSDSMRGDRIVDARSVLAQLPRQAPRRRRRGVAALLQSRDAHPRRMDAAARQPAREARQHQAHGLDRDLRRGVGGSAAVRVAVAPARRAADRVGRRRYRQRHHHRHAEAAAGAKRRDAVRDRHRCSQRTHVHTGESLHPERARPVRAAATPR